MMTDQEKRMRTAVEELQELQAQRRSTMRGIFRLQNQARAIMLRRLGFRPQMKGTPEGKKICKRAEDVIAAIDKVCKTLPEPAQLVSSPLRTKALEDARLGKAGKLRALSPEDVAQADEIFSYVSFTLRGTDPLQAYLAVLEARMAELAQTLPVYDWWVSVDGLAAPGLAIITGEVGYFPDYATPSRVWKRLGLMPFEGHSGSYWRKHPKEFNKLMGLTTDSSTEAKLEAWGKLGYNPQRRSAMWAVGRSLFMGNHDGYREVYDARRKLLEERDPEMKKCILHARSKRYMEKRLLADLWEQWHGVAA